jgi:hypothetical protein
VKIDAASTLREVAFAVCTALDGAGVTAVLTGAGAAVIFAPGVCQTDNLDFVVAAPPDGTSGDEALRGLGFRREGTAFRHEESGLTLGFPAGPLVAGGDLVRRWKTLRESGHLLHVLAPADCCIDRLAGFLFWQDRGSLVQAAAVAGSRQQEVDLEAVRLWCGQQGRPELFDEFIRVYDPRSRAENPKENGNGD